MDVLCHNASLTVKIVHMSYVKLEAIANKVDNGYNIDRYVKLNYLN